MKTVGIIAEYNPFHEGHSYHIKKVKEITGAKYVIAVMSGDFTQRGLPAVIDKYERTKMALSCGIDLVIELPSVYACQSAEYFALGAISILHNLGCVDSICFGSECGDIHILSKIADQLIAPSELFHASMQHYIKTGCSYPEARTNSLLAVDPDFCNYTDVLTTPNNILGIEYIKAIKRLNSPIVPYTMKRIGSDYHDRRLGVHQSSAMAIRHSLKEQNTLELIKDQVPEPVYKILQENYGKHFPIYSSDFSGQLQYKLLTEAGNGFSQYADVSKDLSDKICKNLFKFTDFESFCDTLKSKDLTHARISRCLAHILLDMKAEDLQYYKENGVTFYARMLGFHEKATPLLSNIKQNTKIPLISKLADAKKHLDEAGNKMLAQDILCSHIYESTVAAKFDTEIENEYKRQIIIQA